MRLTNRDKEIPLVCSANDRFWANVHEKLARYEDTGFEPDEIKSLECEWNAMRKVIDSYRSAEDQGLLVRLPCKVGDMVYYKRGRDILGDTVERIVVDGIDNQIILNAHRTFLFCDFGRNVFLTFEECEAAMKGGMGDV